MLSLNKKKILVIGATSGIGERIAFTCQELGASVFASGRNKEKLESLETTGMKGFCFDLNSSLEREKIADDLPRLEGLVFSSGVVHTMPTSFLEESKVIEIMATNFISQALLVSTLLRKKKLSRGCSTIFISSIAKSNSIVGNSIYGASKSALTSFVKSLAIENSKKGLRFNSISPGTIKTPMISKLSAFSEEQISLEESRHLLGLGDTQDVANLACFLLSELSRWTTGTDFVVDGGRSIPF